MRLPQVREIGRLRTGEGGGGVGGSKKVQERAVATRQEKDNECELTKRIDAPVSHDRRRSREHARREGPHKLMPEEATDRC